MCTGRGVAPLDRTRHPPTSTFCISPSPYHFPFFLKNKRLPCSLPKSQRFVMWRWHNIVSTGAYGQAPDFLVVPLEKEDTKTETLRRNTLFLNWNLLYPSGKSTFGLKSSSEVLSKQSRQEVTSRVCMCSNLSASHCLILWSFPAVKKRWDLGTNCRYITLKSEKSDQMSPNSTLVRNLIHSFEELVVACLVIF